VHGLLDHSGRRWPAGRDVGVSTRPAGPSPTAPGTVSHTPPTATPTPPPVVLSVAGSDPSGGAGIQADLKTFSALGAYGCAVLTALTAQNTQDVTAIHLVPTDFVTAQLDTLVRDVHLDAIKIGMLATAATADAVAAFLRRATPAPVVLDPVMVATSGDRLLTDDAVEALRRLLPLASITTPNIEEAAVLLDTAPATDVPAMHAQARALREAGSIRVLLKGGHLSDAVKAVDVYCGPEGEHDLVGERIATPHTHGTGCTLSSAIAALRPQRRSWLEAATEAKIYLTAAIVAADALRVGHGHGPVHHFHHQWAHRTSREDRL